MAFELRPAVRADLPLLIGYAGGTGSGKTYSAFLTATGLSGGERFAVIDTESGRASFYADTFDFDVGELKAPFRPEAYEQAIRTIVEKKKYPVIVVDSMSHEYSGDGGILDFQEEELTRMAGTDFQKREACKFASWVRPKMEHKQFLNKLLQLRTHLVLCFRAEPKTQMTKKDGKWIVEPKAGFMGVDGWFPLTEKNLPFELTDYFLFMPDNPGTPIPIKLMAPHKPFFPAGKPITVDCGRRLAEWSRGANGGAATKTLTEDELRDLALGIQEATTLDQLKELGDRCKLAPAAEVETLRKLYALNQKRLKGQ